MPGPLPKPATIRSRGQRRAKALPPVASGNVPALPADREWHPQAIEWWQAVWTSPMASEYIPSDQYGLLMLVSLVDTFWKAPRASLAAEIRMAGREYGLSPLNRRRLEWAIEKGPSQEPAPVLLPRVRDPRLRSLHAVSRSDPA